MAAPTLKVELLKVTTSGYHDITSYVKSWNTSRGRSRELGRFEAGTFSVTLDNRTRAFDPVYTSSPFNGAIVPRANVKITLGSYITFSGVINDWNLSYDVSGESIATINGSDLFGVLAQQVFTISSTVPGSTGTIWGYSGSFEPELGIDWSTVVGGGSGYGTLNLTNQNPQGQGILEFWQTLERTERGWMFCGRDGLLYFYGREYANTPGVTMTDDGTGVAYSDLRVVYGTELLYNKAVMSRNGGGTATVTNSDSATAYGYSVYDDSGLLYVSDDDLVDAATSLVAQYGSPEYRFDEATFDLHGLSVANQNSLLNLEMADIVTVKYTPNGVGSDISKNVRIIGINHDSTPMSNSVTFRFEEVYDGWFILDSDTAGLLDSNVLGW